MAALSALQGVLADGSKAAHAAPAPEATKTNPVHIRNRRLFDLQDGTIQLDNCERQHLHTCRDCQEVLYVFMTQS